eukprot:1539534-Heterocapsa_arctica.AAC.1
MPARRSHRARPRPSGRTRPRAPMSRSPASLPRWISGHRAWIWILWIVLIVLLHGAFCWRAAERA